MLSLGLFFLRNFVIYSTCTGVIMPLHLKYIWFCIDFFMHRITMSEYRSDSATAPELYLILYWYVCASYNCVWIYMFMYVFQKICCCTSYWIYFLLNPNYGGSFILVSLTNKSHQVDFRILRRPCLVLEILCKMTPVDQCWTYILIIIFRVLEGYCFGQGGNPGISVVWNFSGT